MFKNINIKPVLQMRNGQKIPYVVSCKNVGNEILTVNKKLRTKKAKCDLNCRMTVLIAIVIYLSIENHKHIRNMVYNMNTQ